MLGFLVILSYLQRVPFLKAGLINDLMESCPVYRPSEVCAMLIFFAT